MFGSYARGDAREQSDLDFLVVEQELKSRRKEMVRLHDAIRSMRIPVDIIAVSESTFNEWADVPGNVIYKAKTEGKLCYEKS
jgi:predicted nucleotidyltransferase